MNKQKTLPIDIIIVNYNSTDHTLNCLKSVFHHLDGAHFELFVEDNGSSDNFSRIKTCFPQVRLTASGCNLGFSAAVNNALRRGRGDFILLLNPDTLIRDSSLYKMIDYMIANADVGLVGPKVVNSDGTIQGSARAFPTFLTSLFGRKSILSRWFPNNSITASNILTLRSDGLTPMPVDWVSGACMLIRRSALGETGLFDERFFMYWEDADFCRRLALKRWRVLYLPFSSICHLCGKSSDLRPVSSIYHFHKSSFLLFQKYANRYLFLLYPLLLFALGVRAFFSIISLFFIHNKAKKSVAGKKESLRQLFVCNVFNEWEKKK